MHRISIFDIFKIGVGPSSSHTLGPWKAALAFLELIPELKEVAAIKVHLYGSLSKTGVGHGTDIAVMLGLEGFDPETIETADIPFHIGRINSEQLLQLGGGAAGAKVGFNPAKDIVFENRARSFHPNGLTFIARLNSGRKIRRTYYSIGGGFIVREGSASKLVGHPTMPYPIECADDLLGYARSSGRSIADVVRQNELRLYTAEDLNAKIDRYLNVFSSVVHKGCIAPEVNLPGGLNVKRRARRMAAKLLGEPAALEYPAFDAQLRRIAPDFQSVTSWVSCFALAVNEENAALGRVITSPTNGAAGVIPAVLFYYRYFCPKSTLAAERDFFMVAGEIGSIFKKNATISAAEGGCQAEIGVSSAMAAAALTEVLGGTPEQTLMAAEIAMEHHLGLTCDPIGGLVQIPCIERNAMGAMKAITAANLALQSDPDDAIVELDVVIQTMLDTARAMHSDYKETAEGGLAMRVSVATAAC
ncbi:L-serine ammonia-lyase [Neolewinella persica]|uniref:L-serine ammonia-lyase n=1 Tax=Neolewinella persica TaxID=70998 RepID=UPI00047585AD|nr:L-serine ammonia-lyase [Neolewinella persica]